MKLLKRYKREAFSKRVIALQALHFTRVRGISWELCSQERREVLAEGEALVRGISWELCSQERRH